MQKSSKRPKPIDVFDDAAAAKALRAFGLDNTFLSRLQEIEKFERSLQTQLSEDFRREWIASKIDKEITLTRQLVGELQKAVGAEPMWHRAWRWLRR